MAWSTPITKSTGDLVSAADWNTNTSDNPLAVKAIADLNTVAHQEGWWNDTATWTYASATTFTVSGDVTTTFVKGTRIKLTNSGVKYFVVVGSSYGAPNTTVTVTGGADFALADAAISDNYYSYAVCPQGYPTWFNHTVVHGGFSGEPTDVCRFRIDGNIVHFKYEVPTTAGTSDATTYTVSVPITSLAGDRSFRAMITRVYDNSNLATAPGMALLEEADSVVSLYKTVADGVWTNANSKMAEFELFYEF